MSDRVSVDIYLDGGQRVGRVTWSSDRGVVLTIPPEHVMECTDDDCDAVHVRIDVPGSESDLVRLLALTFGRIADELGLPPVAATITRVDDDDDDPAQVH